MKQNQALKSPLRALALLGCAAIAGSALAGRPLAVDDAGTNALREGHVEVWAARSGGATLLNLSPAYAFGDGLELAALLARGAGNDLSASALQLKWLITPSRDEGCNFGASVGAGRASAGGARANSRFVNTLLSCNGVARGHLHLNLGAVKTSGQSTLGTWGLAFEREFGTVTPHIEWFGAQASKPTWQVGARGEVVKDIQLDGSVGRGDGVTLYSVGLKFKF